MKNVVLVVFALSLFTLTSCQKEYLEPELPETPPVLQNNNAFPGVHSALWDYFQNFEEEAALRGYNVDLRASGITATISEIDEEHVAGLCMFHSHQPNVITIDKSFWNSVDERWREMVVFHELGHCFLGRGHREDRFTNGACVSIMRSGNGICVDNYKASTRTYYLNELFDEDIVGLTPDS